MPKVQEAPLATLAVFVPSKLQLVPVAGATNAKLAALVPVSVALVMLRVAPPGFCTCKLLMEVFAPKLMGPRMIGDGFTDATGFGLAVMVKEKEVGGVGPPPGSGLVMVTVPGIATVRSETGTGTMKPVPPPVTVPPASGIPLNMTVVPGTK